MFMKKPCQTCPFRKGNGEKYRLRQGRLFEIFESTSFPCHETDPRFSENTKGQRQCGGLASVLAAEERPNQLMRIAHRFGDLDLQTCVSQDAYGSMRETVLAHTAHMRRKAS